MIYIIIGITLLLISCFIFYKAYKIKVQKKEQAEILTSQIELQNKTWSKNYQKLQQQQKQLEQNNKQLILIEHEIQQKVQNKESFLAEKYNDLIKETQQAFSAYEENLDQIYTQKEKELYQIKREQVKNELAQIKKTVEAATAARLLEEAEYDKWRFYSIHLTDNQTSDITLLQEWKTKLHDPSIVSKIIWSTYYIKPVGDMCNRVLGTQIKCGVYKLTDKSTGMIYIGQSVNVADRWKTHIKYGLGIDTPITPNKLYQAMQNSSLWYWTFELLEECSKDKLNEREKFWIDFYQSDKVGYNSKGGNK